MKKVLFFAAAIAALALGTTSCNKNEEPATIKLNKNVIAIEVGAQDTLVATVTPAGTAVTWAISDNTIASVDNGVVTGIKEGTAVIVASVNGANDTCLVTVAKSINYVKPLTALEIDFYPSYSEEGAYNYTFVLYNGEDENYLPTVAFDIYTTAKKAYVGTYTMKSGSLTEYSYYVYGTGEDDYFYFTDGEISIADNGNDNYVVTGWFTDGEEVYYVSNVLDGEYFNAEYAYEPEEASTYTLTVESGEIDDTYATSYGIIDIYLTTADGEMQLEYYLPEGATTIEAGTYPIEAAEYDDDDNLVQTYGFFDAGYYYSGYGMPVSSYYMTDDAIFYLVDGNVTIANVQEGVQVTLVGTTYNGSTINADYIIQEAGTGAPARKAAPVAKATKAQKNHKHMGRLAK